MPDAPIAYLITFRTYGTWLHGDERGSTDRCHNVPDTPFLPTNQSLERAERNRLRHDAVALNDEQREVVRRTIIEVCKHQRWELQEINVRTNHVHVVVAAANESPERVMQAFKAWSTRRLREEGLLGSDCRPWSRHGSTKYLWKEEQVAMACRYVLEAQDDDNTEK